MEKIRPQRAGRGEVSSTSDAAAKRRILPFCKPSSPQDQYLTPTEVQRALEEGWSKVVAEVKGERA